MPNKTSQFWQELKRRRVMRVITVYAASAFMILELVDILASNLHLPAWTFNLALILLSAGLIIAVIVSWIYDIQPGGGIVRTEPAHIKKAETEPVTSNSWKIATCVSLVVIVGLIILNIMTGSRFQSGLNSKLEMSIAVLPFQNLSNDTAQSYFCEGIREEILYHLQQIDVLAVRSRTSADHYRNTDKTIPVIGEELNANYLVEGSIGFEGNEIKIWMQLIDARKDRHIWAGDYINERTRVFSLQREIAQKIASELQVVLSPAEIEAMEVTPTENTEAYQAYLRGRYYAGQPHFTLRNWMAALENFQEAVEIDSGFALAYAELARCHSRLRYLREDLSESRLKNADDAARKALQFGGEDPRVHLALGYYYLFAYRDEGQALKHLEIAQQGMPDNAEVLVEKADIILPQGRWEETIELLEKASQISPREISNITHLIFCLWCTRDYDYALEVVERAIALAPGSIWPYLYKAFVIWSKDGPNQESREAVNHIDQDHEWYNYAWYFQEVGEGNLNAALGLLSDTTEIWGVHHKMLKAPASMLMAFIYDYRGEDELARQGYRKAVPVLEQKVLEIPDDPLYHSALGIAYAALGEKGKAIEQGQIATKLLPIEKDAIYGITYIYDFSIIYTLLGEYDLAFDQLEFLFQIPGWLSPCWLNMDIRYAPLKSDPRYHRLISSYTKKRGCTGN